MSIVDEIGAFTIDDALDKSSIDPKVMEEEDKLFKSMNIDFSPDNNLDIVLDTFY